MQSQRRTYVKSLATSGIEYNALVKSYITGFDLNDMMLALTTTSCSTTCIHADCPMNGQITPTDYRTKLSRTLLAGGTLSETGTSSLLRVYALHWTVCMNCSLVAIFSCWWSRFWGHQTCEHEMGNDAGGHGIEAVCDGRITIGRFYTFPYRS